MTKVLGTFASDMLRGQGATVTGGSRGIGRATCLALASAGAHVVVGFARDHRSAEAVCKEAMEFGVMAVPLQVSVSHPESVYRFMSDAVKSLGVLDILVNCAGTWPQAHIHEMDDQEWNDTLAINLSGTFYACKAASRTMMERRHGRIVNFSSIAVVRGARTGHAHYAAAKGGVAALTRTLANELGNCNINVNAVAPGMIRTDMTAHALQQHEDEYCQQTALGRIGLPEEVAGAVLYLVSPAAAYVTGQTLHVNGGSWMS